MSLTKVTITSILAACIMTMEVLAIKTMAYKHNSEHNEINKDVCGCMVGPAGTPGVPGVPGMHGNRGQDGLKGQKGDAGNDGDPGTKGERGQDGPQGPPGGKGDRGRRGHTGTKGRSGVKGDNGGVGPPGVVGPPGHKGVSYTHTKIAFSVVRSNKLGPVLQETPVTFDRILTNTGNHFDVYTSHFVCKVNGTYAFFIHVLGQHKKDAFAWIMLNKIHQVPLHGDGRAGYGTGSNTIILSLRADDHVWIQLSKNSALMNDYSTFSGFLLFEE